jgi:peptide/nickel transport system permease protein
MDKAKTSEAGLLSGLWRILRSILKRFKWIVELFRAPLSALGTLIVLFFVFVAIQGEALAPYEYDDDRISTRFRGDEALQKYEEPDCDFLFNPFDPDCKNPFGTDNAGRDVYSRVILGTREIFRVAGFGTLIAVLIGTAIGLFAGYQGGWIDEIIGRFLDSLLSIPALLLALVLIGTFPETVDLPRPPISISLSGDPFHETDPSYSFRFETGTYEFDMLQNGVLIVLAVVYSPIVARVVRSSVLDIKTREFVEAAQLRGEGNFYILFREILPSVIPSLVVEASLRFSYAIFLVASLGFLGLRADPTIPNWGIMVNEAYEDLDYTCKIIQGQEVCPSWTLNYPAIAIVLLVVGVNLMSDGIKRIVQRNE